MTLAKMSMLVVGFVGAVALGVWIGPWVTDRSDGPRNTAAVDATAPAPKSDLGTTRTPRAAKARVTTASIPDAVDLSAPELHKRLRPILNHGADMSIAASGFRDAEQFATVAHAARNTQVPFMVLKHRVLNEGKTLAAAIRESKPELDAAKEVSIARDEAKQDVGSLAG